MSIRDDHLATLYQAVFCQNPIAQLNLLKQKYAICVDILSPEGQSLWEQIESNLYSYLNTTENQNRFAILFAQIEYQKYLEKLFLDILLKLRAYEDAEFFLEQEKTLKEKNKEEQVLARMTEKEKKESLIRIQKILHHIKRQFVEIEKRNSEHCIAIGFFNRPIDPLLQLILANEYRLNHILDILENRILNSHDDLGPSQQHPDENAQSIKYNQIDNEKYFKSSTAYVMDLALKNIEPSAPDEPNDMSNYPTADDDAEEPDNFPSAPGGPSTQPTPPPTTERIHFYQKCVPPIPSAPPLEDISQHENPPPYNPDYNHASPIPGGPNPFLSSAMIFNNLAEASTVIVNNIVPSAPPLDDADQDQSLSKQFYASLFQRPHDHTMVNHNSSTFEKVSDHSSSPSRS